MCTRSKRVGIRKEKTAEALLLQQRVENGLILGKWADEGSGRGFYILDTITSSQTCSQQPLLRKAL